jgi:hypothetical protein
MSSNPYQSPSDFNQGSQFNSAAPSPDIRNKINAPATGLLVYGILSCVLAFFAVASSALHMAGMNPLTKSQAEDMEKLKDQMGAEQAEFMEQINKISNLTSGPIGLVTNGIVLAIGILTIVTSSKLKRFEGHTMGIVVSALACIPCTSGCCFVGIPIGVWAIVVLMDSNVKAAFRV